jgi:hypothetical protein
MMKNHALPPHAPEKTTVVPASKADAVFDPCLHGHLLVVGLCVFLLFQPANFRGALRSLQTPTIIKKGS